MYILHQAVFYCLVIQPFLRVSSAAYLYNAVSVGFILWLAYHLATCVHSTLVCLCFIRYAQYISVHLFYLVCTVHRCVFVLYRLWLLFLLAVYRMSVQSILIAYFHRCVQCTRYYCQCIYIYSRKCFFVTVIYLPCHNLQHSRCLGLITAFLFLSVFTYRNYLAVTLIWQLWGCLFIYFFLSM